MPLIWEQVDDFGLGARHWTLADAVDRTRTGPRAGAFGRGRSPKRAPSGLAELRGRPTHPLRPGRTHSRKDAFAPEGLAKDVAATRRGEVAMTNAKDTSQSQASRKSQDPPEADDTEETEETQETRSDTDRPAAKRPRPMEVLREARAQLSELTGLTPESVSSFVQTEDGWALEVEVLELERVPDTMSLMASYQVELDLDGQLTGYRKVRRYERGRADARGGH
ncbi:hypothetical protein ACE1SV_53530 [Streptomyces sp. E-15]